MKQLHHTMQVGAQTTFGEVWQWGQQLERLHARIAPRFGLWASRAALVRVEGTIEVRTGVGTRNEDPSEELQ